MARGRQPLSLLEYKGKKHLTKKEIEERKSTEVQAPSDKIKPPTYLPPDLKREFKKTSEELKRVGIMTNLDVDTLARFLFAKKLYLEVTDQMLKMPSTEMVPYSKKDKDGDIIEEGEMMVPNEAYSQMLINQDKLFKQCKSAASDLGLTIASRCRLVVPKSEETKKSEGQQRFGDRL